MKILQINTFPNKATGSIMMNIHKKLLEEGCESYVVWGRGRNSESSNEIDIKDNLGVKIHGVYTRITDKTGFASKRATKKLLEKLDKIEPDIIHLHNIHGYYINIKMLFDYIREKKIKVVWTLHDCWPFTGHCAYFDLIECEKWKFGCESCPQKNTYPASKIIDNSKWNWGKKRELFRGLNITIVTPSIWLEKHVKQSFLRDYPVKVINNGIDLDIFRPTRTDFETKYEINGKKVILGVASEWTDRKGLKDFIELSKLLDKERFIIVMVGLSKQQIAELPRGIVGIERTSNILELVGMYTQARYFFNPTYEDNFPTTNLESVACGTPVITYKTGGSPETLNSDSGVVFNKGDVCLVADYINKSTEKKNVYPEEQFSKLNMINKYLELYYCVNKE